MATKRGLGSNWPNSFKTKKGDSLESACIQLAESADLVGLNLTARAAKVGALADILSLPNPTDMAEDLVAMTEQAAADPFARAETAGGGKVIVIGHTGHISFSDLDDNGWGNDFDFEL